MRSYHGWYSRFELPCLDFPSGHQRHIKSTNVLKRPFQEVKRRTKVVGVFPNEESLANLATVVMLRASEDWAFRRYMDMAPLSRRGRETHKNRDLTDSLDVHLPDSLFHLSSHVGCTAQRAWSERSLLSLGAAPICSILPVRRVIEYRSCCGRAWRSGVRSRWAGGQVISPLLITARARWSPSPLREYANWSPLR
ncbi:transposase [Pyrinomonas methylaliphatogenes]